MVFGCTKMLHMSKSLSSAVIRKRMVEWQNYKRLYPELRRKYEEVKEENRQLKCTVAEQQAVIERLLLRVEQLETMVFGRKPPPPNDHDDGGSAAPPSERRPRSSSSYRRAVPLEEEITSRTTFPITACPDCGHALRKKETVLRFIEDIPLPGKTVQEHSIERGWCPHCRKTCAAIPIAPQRCILGENVRLYILYAVTVLGLTFEKVKAHLQGLHNLPLSDGEITAILHEGHRKLLPARNGIDAKIRDAPVAHYDETGYPVQGGDQGNFAWVKTSATGPETIFLLGRTRGKGNAAEMRGPPSQQVAMTDDYPAYDSLFAQHALCWAHPLRKFRDLARSDVLPEEQHTVCQSFYEAFSLLERDVALTIAAPLTTKERSEARARFASRIASLMLPSSSDPPKLSTLKKTFQENTEQYLLCVTTPGVPMTNNQAERRLRHLVIKRLLSFGSRTQKGAQTIETLLSVLLTLWWSRPKDYFGELRSLMAA